MYGVRMERSMIVRFSLANNNTVFAVGKNDAVRDGIKRAVHGLLLRMGAVGEKNGKPSIQLSLVQPRVSSSAKSVFTMLAGAGRGAKTASALL
jgi:hypothetical protein